MRVRWRPILDGEVAGRAHETINAIADALRGAILDSGMPADPRRRARLASVESGPAGLARFYAYLARSRPAQDDGAIVARGITTVIEAASALDVGLSLHDGAPGVAWAASHLRRLGAGPWHAAGGEAFSQRIDRRLLEHLGRRPWTDEYDLINGLVGHGVYALERFPDPRAVTCLELVVDRLGELAVRWPDGTCWWTSPELTRHADRFPHGLFNLGLAHGVPGVIGFLGLACAANVAAALARPLLDEAVAWLLGQRRPADDGSCFPSWTLPSGEPGPTRLAWCYGDPGVAAALLLAARCVGEPGWEREALAIALDTAECRPEMAHVVDTPLCHGAIGVGHLFNRLYQATGRVRLRKAARSWFERGLALRSTGGKLGGFHALISGDGVAWHRVAFRGLLNGAAGIGLALLAATTPIEPSWDRLLLTSIPPGRPERCEQDDDPAGPGSNRPPMEG